MSDVKTLLQMAGAPLDPNSISESVLILIDIQGEYRMGAVPLPDVDAATAVAAQLLTRARAAGSPIVHVQHKGAPGGMFDLDGARGQLLAEVTAIEGEHIIHKDKPNAFADTNLHKILQETGRTKLIVVGFMTHMCVSSTVRAGFDLGYWATVARDACATRDLPNPAGGVVAAADLHTAALAGLSDRFGIIATSESIPD